MATATRVRGGLDKQGILVSLGSEDSGGVSLALARFPCLLGRHPDCDLRLGDPEISRRHCAFLMRDGRVWLEDLGSLNGTRLNGAAVTGIRSLADGDRLELGPLTFHVRLCEAPASPAVTHHGSRPVRTLAAEDSA